MADLNDIINTLIAEANAEGPEGMRRVAETILNRAAIRGIDPSEVVRQPSQYTGYFAPGPAAVQAQRDPNVRTAAEAAWELARQPGDPTNGADHYYNPSIVDPGWQRSMQPTGDFGGHTFYRSRDVPQDRLASILAPPATRDVPFPRNRPTSPMDQIAQLFSGTSTNAAAGRRPEMNAGLDQFIAQQRSQAPLSAPRQADNYVKQAQGGQDPLLARALESFIQQPQKVATASAPRMNTSQQRADNGQTGTAGLSRSTQKSIADMFGINGDPGGGRGQTVATVSTKPSGVGQAPATRTVQSVAVAPKAAPKQTTAQVRADNGQNRAAPARPAATAKAPAPPKMTAAQQRADNGQGVPVPRKPATPPKIDGIGDMGSFSDLAAMFGPTVPQARQSINANKDQSRLKTTSVIGRADSKVLADHGLLPAPKPVGNVPLPRPRPQVPLPRPRPQVQIAPASTRVAITPPAVRRTVTGIGPTPLSQRPVGVAQGRIAAPVIAPRATVQRAPLRVVVNASPARQSFNPSNHSSAQLKAAASGKSTFTRPGSGVSEPVRAMNGKLRNTY